jgi:hypothetical protein
VCLSECGVGSGPAGKQASSNSSFFPTQGSGPSLYCYNQDSCAQTDYGIGWMTHLTSLIHRGDRWRALGAERQRFDQFDTLAARISTARAY